MAGPDMERDKDIIRELIEGEQAKALARFRDSRFGERLKRRLAERTVGRLRPAPLFPALRPVSVVLAVLIVVGAAAVWLLRPRTSGIESGTAVTAFLRGLPGLQAIEFPAPLSSGASPLPASPLEKNISSVLSVSKRTGGAPGPGPGRGFSVIDPGSEPLGLRRFYEILIIDRSVERVLSDISPKIKEG